ncbi:hypothetical protein Tco_1536329, partial [Tanacetum coccineum]
RDDANDEDEDDEDEEEEEEHLAPADSPIVVPVDEPVFPHKETEPVIPPPSTDITIGARITVRPQTSISLSPEAKVERLLDMTTPSPSPPISLSPPSAGERLARCIAPPAHSSLPHVPSPLLLSSGCPTQIQTLRIGIRDVGYDIRDIWVDLVEAVLEIAPMTVREVNNRVTELAELHEHDTRDLYALLEDAQDSRSRISLHGTLIQTHHHVHKTRFQIQQAELAALRETDYRRQAQMVETFRVIRDMRQDMSDMQAELLALLEQQRRARQPGPEARIPDHQDASRDADSHI